MSEVRECCSAVQAEAHNQVVVVAVTASENVLDAPAVGTETGEVLQSVGVGSGKGEVLLSALLIGN